MFDRNPDEPQTVESSLIRLLRGIDVYLLDQVMKGNVGVGKRVLDAGCGHGRNIAYFMQAGHDVCAIDISETAVSRVKELAHELAPGSPAGNIQPGRVEDLVAIHGEAAFDLVICIAVLHFAENPAHFEQMLDSLWATLAPGGILFARLATNMGVEAQLNPVDGAVGRDVMGDGSTRFVVSMDDLLAQTERLGGKLLEPIKSVVVQDLRSMGVWVIRKP